MEHDSTPAAGTSAAGRLPPPVEHQFQPGQSGNPAGRPKNAGQSLRECINKFVADDLAEDALRRIARGKHEPLVRRAAAERLLRTLEAPDMADYEDVLTGKETLREARSRGLNTEAIRKIKRKSHNIEVVGGAGDGDQAESDVECEIELYDRAGTDFDRVMDRTEGRPTQAVKLDATIDAANIPTVSAFLLSDANVLAAALDLEERLRHAGGSGELPHAE